MPNTSAVAQYLPFLRRYARALTGNQTSGDAYVAATLEALIADRSLIDEKDGVGPSATVFTSWRRIKEFSRCTQAA